MKWFLTALLPVLLLCAGCVRSPQAPRLPASAPRIVSLAPSVTETLFALGAGPEVVGVSDYCDFPREARQLPRVGSFITPNVEAIVALRPTGVIGLATSANLPQIRALRAMGVPTLMADDGEGRSVEAIEHSILVVGDWIGRGIAARSLVAQLREQLTEIAARSKTHPAKSVLMVVGHQPLVAVGPGAYLDQLLTMAGAKNIAAPAAQAWPRLSIEFIIASGPDVILDGQMGTDPTTPAVFWRRYPMIPAVRHHQVFGYPESPTLHPGPRIGLTLALLARKIHPELFAQSGIAAAR